MKKINLIIALALTSVFVLSACNTVKGAGKDIERGGEKIQKAVS